MKHKKLYLFLSFLENVIMIIIASICVIILCSVPIGNYTIRFIILKVIALFVLCIIAKVENIEEI